MTPQQIIREAQRAVNRFQAGKSTEQVAAETLYLFPDVQPNDLLLLGNAALALIEAYDKYSAADVDDGVDQACAMLADYQTMDHHQYQGMFSGSN